MISKANRSHAISSDASYDFRSYLSVIPYRYDLSAYEVEGVRSSIAADFIGPAYGSLVNQAFPSRILWKVLEERLRITIFALNGIAVFCAGLLIQVSLVEYAHQTYILSYVVQTAASVQINFLLSRYVTWSDRSAGFWPSLVRFNLQQLVITGLGMAAYSGLELLHVDYILANFAVTGILAPVSFLASHNWSIAQKTRGRRHRRARRPGRSSPRG